MAIVVYDNFNGANGTDLDAHSPDIDVVGSGWNQSGANEVELDGSGAVKFASAADGAWIDTGSNDQIVTASINAGGSDNRFQLVVRSDNDRGADGTNYSLNMRQGVSGSDNITLFKRVSGSLTSLASAQVSFNASTTNEFELSAIGNNIIAKVDGVEIFNVIDNSISTGSYAGFYHAAYTNNALRVYGFEVDDGGGGASELHTFSGTANVNVLALGQSEKLTALTGSASINALASASSSKVVALSGQSSVDVASISLLTKVNTFSGNATIDVLSQSSASKHAELSGNVTVNVIATASIIDGNFEIHSFSGGALITASASGQAVKIGLVSGSANVTASTSAQASKTAQLSGNATISTSTRSLFSKIASISGNALTRVTTLASVIKRVTLSGVSRVFATAYGTFFNTESNVETYELTVQGRVKAPIVVQGRVKAPIVVQGRVKAPIVVQGRVKAPIVVQGTIKSLTIQGRVK